MNSHRNGSPVILILPFPPSVNTYYRRGQHATYLSKAGRDYKETVADIVAEEQIQTISGRLYVSIALSSKTKREYDIDNRIKAVLDALQDAGVFDDDEQIDEINVVRREPGGDYAKVLVIRKDSE